MPRRLAALVSLLVLGASLAPQTRAQDRAMMQGFYWDVEPGGVWYDTLAVQAPRLGAAGFDAIWLPPPTKGAASGWDVGYTPYDYYDLGGYDSCGGDHTQGQGGCIPTRYGTAAGLRGAVDALHASGLEVYADVVLNHRSGGSLEDNDYAAYYTWGGGSLYSQDGQTYTAFPLTHGSGRIAWPAGQGDEFFFPNASNNPGNTGDFYSETQLAGFHRMYTNSFAYDNALHDGFGDNLPLGDSLMAWGDWLTSELGLDGYRFDFVKGIHPEYLKRWVDHGAMRGKFHVHELYDGDTGRLRAYYDQLSGSQRAPAVFDFSLRFAYKDVLDGGAPIYRWQEAGLLNQLGFPTDAIVTFVDNHDFDRIDYRGEVAQADHSPVVSNKMLAYAHLLTHPGLATVWWRDYFRYNLAGPIDALLNIRQQYASGPYYALTRGDIGNPYWPNPGMQPWDHLYVGQRTGDGPNRGLIVAINKHPVQWAEVWVTQQHGGWAGQTLRDVTGHGGGGTTQVQPDGRVRVWAPPQSYTVWVPEGYPFTAAGDRPVPGAASYHDVDFANLQGPATSTVDVGAGAAFTARTYVHGRTNAGGAGAGVVAWIGHSTADTDPATWTEWVPAAYAGDVDHLDAFSATLTLPAGTHFVASRFSVDGQAYRYGGVSPDGGGFWDGADHASARLAVSAGSACAASALHMAGFTTGDPDGESIDVGNQGGAPADLSGCSVAVFDPYTAEVTWSADLAGSLAAGATYRIANVGFAGGNVDQPLPARAVPEGPGALAVLAATAPQAGTSAAAVAPFVRAAVVYFSEGDVYGRVPQEATRLDGLLAGVVAASAEDAPAIPARVAIAGAFPNPARGAFAVRFGLPGRGEARVALFDVLGREVAVLFDGPAEAGWHDARAAATLPPGVYVARLQAGGRVATRTVTVVR